MTAMVSKTEARSDVGTGAKKQTSGNEEYQLYVINVHVRSTKISRLIHSFCRFCRFASDRAHI